jgi:hypothetical protein
VHPENTHKNLSLLKSRANKTPKPDTIADGISLMPCFELTLIPRAPPPTHATSAISANITQGDHSRAPEGHWGRATSGRGRGGAVFRVWGQAGVCLRVCAAADELWEPELAGGGFIFVFLFFSSLFFLIRTNSSGRWRSVVGRAGTYLKEIYLC